MTLPKQEKEIEQVELVQNAKVKESTLVGLIAKGAVPAGGNHVVDRLIMGFETAKPANQLHRVNLDLNNSEGQGGALILRTATAAVDDATPSVKNVNVLLVSGSSSWNITDLDDGVVGQIVTIQVTAQTATFVTSASLVMAGSGADYVALPTHTITFCMFTDQIWTEIARSVNS